MTSGQARAVTGLRCARDAFVGRWHTIANCYTLVNWQGRGDPAGPAADTSGDGLREWPGRAEESAMHYESPLAFSSACPSKIICHAARGLSPGPESDAAFAAELQIRSLLALGIPAVGLCCTEASVFASRATPAPTAGTESTADSAGGCLAQRAAGATLCRFRPCRIVMPEISMLLSSD